MPSERTRDETFQFWYRTVVVILLGAAVTGTGAVIKFQWDNRALQARLGHGQAVDPKSCKTPQ